MNARGSLLRRLGGGAVTLAVLTLGVAGGLVLGAPASAADTGDIQVKMAGDTAFSSVAAAPLAVKLRKGDTVTLTVSASLPPRTGNAVAYGKLTFDLQLALATVGPGNSGGNGGGPGNHGNGAGGPAPNGPNARPTGTGPDVVEVLGTSQVAAVGPGAGKPGSVLVLGKSGGSLSYTGLPLYAMLGAGGGVLVVGIVLIMVGRRECRPGHEDSQ